MRNTSSRLRDRKENGGCWGLARGMGAELRSVRMERSGDGWWRGLHNNASVLNATELALNG